MNPTREYFRESGFQAALQGFLSESEKRELEWIQELPFPVHSDRGLAFLLLSAALRGLIPQSRLSLTLLGFWEKWGQDLFRLSHLKYEDLAQAIAELPGVSPIHLQKIPGVLRSVSDFFFKTGSLSEWLQKSSSGSSVIQTLGDEIFWMGKSSRYRNKPRYFLWLLFATEFPNARLFENVYPPLTQGHFRFVFEWATPFFKKQFFAASVSLRFEKMAELMREGGSPSPWFGFLALEGFLEKVDANRFRCQNPWNGCLGCPMATYCKIGLKHLDAETVPSQFSAPKGSK